VTGGRGGGGEGGWLHCRGEEGREGVLGGNTTTSGERGEVSDRKRKDMNCATTRELCKHINREAVRLFTKSVDTR